MNLIKRSAWPTRPNWLNAPPLIAIHLIALLALWPGFFSWSAVAVAALLAYITGAIGVTLGYHRTLTHRSLRLRWGLEYVVATLGVLALQGAPIEWVATHRVHHAKFRSRRRSAHRAPRRDLGAHAVAAAEEPVRAVA